MNLCLWCDAPVEDDETFCSDACLEAWEGVDVPCEECGWYECDCPPEPFHAGCIMRFDPQRPVTLVKVRKEYV